MVYSDNFTVLTDEKKAQYKFDFCRGCALYDECELVEEYVRFRDNHSPIHKSQISQATGDVLQVKATAVPIGECGTDSSRPLVNARVVSGAEPMPSVGDTSPSGAGTGRASYDQEEVKDGCLMSRQYVYPIACGKQRVTDGIGDHYRVETRKDYTMEIVTGTLDRWEPLQPVFISAQTGRGKNFFIENTLIPYVRELNYKNNTSQRILILSNRLALRQQIKNRLNEEDDPTDERYPYGEYADVMTYQSLLRQEHHLNKKQKKAHSRYIYVICDEAHFFTSDAMFNPYTAEILSAIVRLFQDAIRVYMSATPYECLEYIIKYEREYHSRLSFNRGQEKDKSIPMAFYHFERDYSYLDVKAYSSIAELYEQIVKSVNKQKETDREKWLIFIDDKEKGATVKRQLLEYEKNYAKEHGGSQVLSGADEEAEQDEESTGSKATTRARPILVANAGSKTEEAYMSMVKNEELGNGTYVLITTSVLDNGVNLKGINNVVVSDMAKVKCLQMVGRARISGEDDRKTLYIKRFGGGEVWNRLKNFDRQKEAYHRYNLAYGESRDLLRSRTKDIDNFINKYYHGSGDDWRDAEHWFGHPIKSPTELYFNEIAKSLLDGLVSRYQFIYNEMIEEGPTKDDKDIIREGMNRSGQKYLEYELSWFGKSYCVDDDLTFADKDKGKKALVAFLESYADSGTEIADQADRIKFQADFTELYEAAFGPISKNKRENKGTAGLQMNRALAGKQIGYKIYGRLEQGPWTIIKTDESQENPE